MFGHVVDGVGSCTAAPRSSKYSRWLLVENPTRPIHWFAIRLVACTSNPR